MTEVATRSELAARPVVVQGALLCSSLDIYPPPDSPLRESALTWTPVSREEIADSIARARRRRWWRR